MNPSFGTVPLLDEPIPSYFTLLLVGFGLATWIAARWAKRGHYDHQAVIDLGLHVLIAGVVGARILHVFADGYFWDYVHLCTDPARVDWVVTRAQCTEYEGVWDNARNLCHPGGADCFAWAKFWQGGLTYYGGLVAGLLYGAHFVRREGLPLRKILDVFGMVAPLGLFWGRLGCFFGGCCFGRMTDGVLGLRFPPWSAASESQFKRGVLRAPYLESLPVHSTQLYEAASCLAIAALMMFVVHPRKRFDGEVVLTFLASYAVVRFALEYLRDDDRGGVLGLSTSQGISLLALLACAATWAWLRRSGARSRLRLPRTGGPTQEGSIRRQ